MKQVITAVLAFLALTCAAMAQNPASVRPCVGTNPCVPVSAGAPLPVTGSFSATTTGFNAETYLTPITATTGGVTATSFTAGKVVVVTNVGTTNIAYCKFGATADTTGQAIAPNGGWFAFTSVANTQITCATSTSTTTVNLAVGTGLPTGTGGGGGGSGGGGAITIASGAVASGAYSSGSIASGAYASGSVASGAMVDLGAIADAAATAGSTGTISAKLRLATTQLATINTTLGTPLQAGGTVVVTGVATAANQSSELTKLDTLIANTGADVPSVTGPLAAAAAAATKSLMVGGQYLSTQPTMTNTQQAAVLFSPRGALYMTSGVEIPTFKIDQTTPGTTNLVAAGQVSQYPIGATAITASATGTTAATTATLAGTSGKTTYICGYSIRANATAAATVTNTITGVITATLSSIMWVAPLASGIGIDEQIFSPCVPASATNTGIAIVSGAPGSGGTVSSKGWGYQL